MVGHGRFLLQFLANASEQPALDLFVLQTVHELIQDDELDTIPKAWLIKRLAHFLVESFPDDLPEIAAALPVLDSMNTAIPWLNRNHPEVAAARQDITETLARVPDIPSIRTRLTRQRRLLATALSRQIRFVGFVGLDTEPGPEPLLAGATPDCLWILVAGPQVSQPYFKVAYRADSAGHLRPLAAAAAELRAGQVLFAPADGRQAKELLESLPGAPLPATQAWPAAWPVNAR